VKKIGLGLESFGVTVETNGSVNTDLVIQIKVKEMCDIFSVKGTKHNLLGVAIDNNSYIDDGGKNRRTLQYTDMISEMNIVHTSQNISLGFCTEKGDDDPVDFTKTKYKNGSNGYFIKLKLYLFDY